MSRLTEEMLCACDDCELYFDCGYGTYSECEKRKFYEKVQYYEDLEEQGRLIELPCKVGDTVWLVEKNFPQYPPIKFKFSRKSDIMREMEKGMIFEKTKEEAEAKLKELREGAE